MPIRMTKDRGMSSSDNFAGSGGGGRLPGGMNAGCLAALLPLLFKRPKLLIVILIIGALFYFIGGQKSCGIMNLATGDGGFSMGGMLDERMYDKAEVYEPLADNINNPLPERVSLEQFCPVRRNQGAQGSCVAWASAYGARSILKARESGQNPDQVAFSPSFLYNQIGLEGCQGSYIIRAMENMAQVGALPFDRFPYDEQDCSRQPAQEDFQLAGQFRTKGFNRLSRGGDDYKTDLLAIKQNLAQNAPVVIGMMVGGSFMQDMVNKKVWIPQSSDYQMNGFGGHAMCVIGYDDYLEGGAFQIMNSWGQEWGEKGIAWVRYKDFDHFVKEAYGLYPMGTTGQKSENMLTAEIGLVQNASGQGKDEIIPLQYRSENVYSTRNPLSEDTRFKLQVTNNMECYTYVFGQETDGSSYVLFPYTAKHSPYCGITGTRLFPKDYSMQPDSIGNKDLIAIVMTKAPMDYKKFNRKISLSRKLSYSGKVKEALGEQLPDEIQFADQKGLVSFSTELTGQQAVMVIVEVNKR
jgi:hypothetical protein